MGSLYFEALSFEELKLLVTRLAEGKDAAFEDNWGGGGIKLCFRYQDVPVYMEDVKFFQGVPFFDSEYIGDWSAAADRVLVHLHVGYHQNFTINVDVDHPEMLSVAQRYILLVDAKEYLTNRLAKVQPGTRVIFKKLLEEVLQALTKLTK